MIADAMNPIPGAAPQLPLFEALPEDSSRRRPRRARLTIDEAREAALAVAAAARPQPVIIREPFDPATLTNAELRSLARTLSDDRLSHLLMETARETRRRLSPDDPDSIENQPDPALMRAARVASGELGGRDE